MEPSQGANSFIQKIGDEWKKLNMTPLMLAKIIGGGVAALLVVAFVFQMINATLYGVTGGKLRLPGPMATVSQGVAVGGYGGGYGGGASYGEVAYDSVAPSMAPMPPSDYDGYSYAKEESGMQLSTRNVANSMLYPQPSGVPGDDAEQYQVMQYNANIETGHLKDTCDTVAGLKARQDVIFENANVSDRNCNFTFKVKLSSVEEVLALIKKLDPKDLSESAYTIKREIEDYTSEVEVLTKKRVSIDETLASAVAAYNEVTTLATRSQNADALAKIINSKIQLIERLTQERININEQLDRLSRSKAEQLDRLDYTYFYVNVFERKYIDGEQIFDSWKYAIQNFVYEFNSIVQGITLKFLLVLALILQWALYALIALFVIKYGWRAGKYLWLR